MNFKSLFFIILSILFWSNPGFGQDTLLVTGQSFTDGVILRWQPLNPNVWADMLTKGYRIERQELPTGQKVVLAERVLPNDTTWFDTNKFEADGMMEPIGALIHDTTFQFKDKSLLDANALRYNYVLYEAQFDPSIAIAVGAGLIDTLVTSQKRYRYTVTGIGTSLTSSVELIAGIASTVSNPEGVDINYVFPNDRSLSSMSPAKQNYTFPQIFGKARAYGDSIVLRWGPNTLQLFREAKKNGYIIERRGGGEELKEIGLVKPWSQSQITPAIDHDTFAMLAASNLYPLEDGGASSIYDKAALEESRYGFSLYAAEQSSLAADILGLRYVDREVKSGETYYYNIKTLTTPSFLSHAEIDIENTYVPPPPPEGFTLSSGDKEIILNWAKEANDNNFSSYRVERSEDNVNWESLTSSPLVFVESDEIPLGSYGFRDSVGINYKTFYYRLQGYDSFGEISEAAMVNGQAVDLTPPAPPVITEGEYFAEENKIIIKWQPFPPPEDFTGYWVLMGERDEGKYDTLTLEPLAADVEEFTYSSDSISGHRAHYFRILVKDYVGNIAQSEPSYVHVPDLIPPELPTDFNGIIGDDGTVSLSWEHSISSDIAGYWIYFANDPNDEFSPVNPEPIEENYYEYQIDERSLNKSIYYMISSEDNSSNRGDLSEILELKRPDKVPPITPFQFQPEGNSQGISISWQRSPSDDVMSYHIYRRMYGSDDDWELVNIASSESDSIFLDTSVTLDVIYEYKMLAEDESGNQSEYTLESSSKRSIDPADIKVENFSAQLSEDEKSIILSWSFEPPEGVIPPDKTYEFVILKSTSANNMDYLAKVSSGTFQYTDTQVPTPLVLYNYAVQVTVNNGVDGELSSIKSVMIE